jgi:hypothetical protein
MPLLKKKMEKKKYIVAEPELTTEEQKILEDTKQELINKISLIDLKDEKSLLLQVEKYLIKIK